MPKKTVTIQAIADAVGVSRNTVSKVINGHPVPIATREKIVEKAIEMGYKGFAHVQRIDESLPLRLLLLTGRPLSNLDFFLSMIRGIESSIQKYDIDFFQYTLGPNTTSAQLKNYIESLAIDGIIGIELYAREHLNHVLSIGTPVVFIDSFTFMNQMTGNYDVILMEGMQNIYRITTKLIEHGAKTFGFVGDPQHCQGFYERYLGMREALFDRGIPFNPSYCILDPDDSPYGDVQWTLSRVASLDHIPDVFICANDSIAIPLVEALKKLYLNIPEDVQVIGFDNITEASLNSPALTTIDIDKEQLGQEIIHTLLQRIKRATIPNRTIYLRTNIVYRRTTSKRLKQ
ncbi:MAG: LacI family DNA-binding transcriptional regulator, partial [Acholeplasmataceae bacterium]